MLNTPGVTNGLAFQSVTIMLTDGAIFQKSFSENTLAVWSEVRTILYRTQLSKNGGAPKR